MIYTADLNIIYQITLSERLIKMINLEIDTRIWNAKVINVSIQWNVIKGKLFIRESCQRKWKYNNRLLSEFWIGLSEK